MYEPPESVSHADDARVNFFNELADRWDRVGQDPQETVRQLTRHADLLGLTAGEQLLEVGCGTGQISAWLASKIAPGRLVAIDFASAMLHQAAAKNIAAEFRQADVCCDCLGRNCYDAVLCFHAFPHFRDQAKALEILARTLRPTGRLIIMHLAGSAQINSFHDQVGGAVGGDHLPSRPHFQELLSSQGLAIDEYIDREDLFFLRALRGSRTAG